MLFLCVLSPVFYIYFKYSSHYERRDGVLYQDVIPRNAEPLRKAGARFSRKSLYVPDGMQKKREMNFLWFDSFSKERASEKERDRERKREKEREGEREREREIQTDRYFRRSVRQLVRRSIRKAFF